MSLGAPGPGEEGRKHCCQSLKYDQVLTETAKLRQLIMRQNYGEASYYDIITYDHDRSRPHKLVALKLCHS